MRVTGSYKAKPSRYKQSVQTISSNKDLNDMVNKKEFLDFVVIGAMKAGTTSLYHYMSQHPELSVPFTKKEVSFLITMDAGMPGLNGTRRILERQI